jgi:hypothetical protein
MLLFLCSRWGYDDAYPDPVSQAAAATETAAAAALPEANKFRGLASEFGDDETAAIVALIGEASRDGMVDILRNELKRAGKKKFHSLQHCKNVVGAFWREEEKVRCDRAETAFV